MICSVPPDDAESVDGKARADSVEAEIIQDAGSYIIRLNQLEYVEQQYRERMEEEGNR